MTKEYPWDKVMAPGEILQKEFSLSLRFTRAVFITTSIVSVATAFLSFIAGILVFSIGILYWYYVTHAKHYAFTNKRIILIDAMLGSNTISINYNQITDIEITQSFFDQIGQWGTIIINTAGTHVPEVTLSFIEHPQEIKQALDMIRDSQH